MQTLTLEHRENIAVVTLSNGLTNAINPDLVREFSNLLEEIKTGAKGMVLCGGEKFFSMGFDLPVLLGFNRSDMTDFLYGFNRLILDLYTLSLPGICALSGHAAAGGAILALPFDYRFADDGTKKIGLNEIKLGVPVPYLPDMILGQIMGRRAAMQMIYSGEFMSFSDATPLGLIDEISPAGTVTRKAIEKAMEFECQLQAFAVVKEGHTQGIKNQYKNDRHSKDNAFLDCWFSPPTRERLLMAAEKF